MEMRGLIICVLFSLFTVTLCSTPRWKSCDPGTKYGASVTAVETSAPLDKDNNTVLAKGTNVTVAYSFKISKGTVTSATSVVHGIIAELPVPFKIPNPNACKSSGLSCPLKSPASYKYHAVIPVPKESPSIRLIVKWELKDESKGTIWCVEIPADITG